MCSWLISKGSRANRSAVAPNRHREGLEQSGRGGPAPMAAWTGPRRASGIPRGGDGAGRPGRRLGCARDRNSWLMTSVLRVAADLRAGEAGVTLRDIGPVIEMLDDDRLVTDRALVCVGQAPLGFGRPSRIPTSSAATPSGTHQTGPHWPRSASRLSRVQLGTHASVVHRLIPLPPPRTDRGHPGPARPQPSSRSALSKTGTRLIRSVGTLVVLGGPVRVQVGH